jgi:hypothetical protein
MAEAEGMFKATGIVGGAADGANGGDCRRLKEGMRNGDLELGNGRRRAEGAGDDVNGGAGSRDIGV